MAQYLLIESRDPFESNDVGYYYDLAKGLVDAGNQVTLFLAQNGVLSARPSTHSAALSALALREKAFGSNNPQLVNTMHNLAELYRTLGRNAEAEALNKRAEAIKQKTK